MKHWRIDDVAWADFDALLVDPSLVPLVKAAALVERNGTDYGIYLDHVFPDDPAFRQAVANWTVEEVQHGDTLGRWAMLADPEWDFAAAFARFRAGYSINLTADASVRGSRTGELIARCIVETGTSSYYTALGETAREPVLQQICRLIAADEFRHFKLFYDHMRRYLARENISFLKRLRIAAGRIGESEDDELAFAFHCANNAESLPYNRRACVAAYLSRASEAYRYRHIERGTGMVFKTVGLPPRGQLSNLSSKLLWRLLQYRRDRLTAQAA
jgi:hypothetical protein